MKTREQWVEEVMQQIGIYTDRMLTLDKQTSIIKPIDLVKIINAEDKKLRALLLEVPDPEGWKLVKVVSTGTMSFAGAQTIRFDTTAINKLHTANLAYQAMIEASPEYKGES